MNFFKCAILAVFTVITVFVVDSHAFGRRGIFGRRGGCGGGQPIISCQPISVCNNGVCAVPVIPVVPVVAVQQVFTPVAVPIFVPTFQFQYQPAPCVPNGVTFPGANLGYTQPGMGYLPQPSQPNTNLGLGMEKERIKALARALLEEMSKENDPNNQEQDDGPPMALEPNAQFPSPPNPSRNFLTVLANRCSSCHATGPNYKGGPVMFDANLQFNPQTDKTATLDAVEKFRMPKGALNDPRKRLTQQEYNILYAWAKSR
jgi:hypothetical protein